MRGPPSSFSPTDLSSFFECRHRTTLTLRVRGGTLERPGQSELQRELLERRGREHERRVLDNYRARGLRIFEASQRPHEDDAARRAAAAETLAAMRDGYDLIYQGTLSTNRWNGRPDFLLKAPARADPSGAASRFGQYVYEPVDAKLARHEKARAVLQLCVYADQLEAVQGVLPARIWLVPGGADTTPTELRTADYVAYARQAKRELERFVEDDRRQEPYPEPVEYCGVCEWWRRCEERRKHDDHLSLVAGTTRRQRLRLAESGATTLEALAGLSAEQRIPNIDEAPLRRIREQAQIQREGRAQGRTLYELLTDAYPKTGLETLPEPRPGDLFLDLEGDAFVHDTGLEYLFGLVELGEPVFDFSVRQAPGEPRYRAYWATTPTEEKAAFEAMVDRIQRGREEFANLHVYHFGHREKDAMKKLACKHATREDVIDDFLRDGVLVDLHTVVRQGLRASVEAYTLKNLEPLYAFERKVDLRDAGKAMQLFGWWLETGESPGDVEEVRRTIEGYNREDCLSTWRLRDWLEARRDELAGMIGRPLARPVAEEPKKPDEKESALHEQAADVARQLVATLSDDPSGDGEDERARRLLADLLLWHRREEKSTWWEYFEARDTPRAERLESRLVLAGLRYAGRVGKVKQSHVHRYEFDDQEHAIRRVPSPHDADTRKQVTVHRLGPSFVELKRGIRSEAEHPTALIPGRPLEADNHKRRLITFGRAMLENDAAPSECSPAAEWSAARDLLLRRPPRCGQSPDVPLVRKGEDPVDAVVRLCHGLKGTTLAIQGPPGSGKTYCAVQAIRALVAAGKKVGVTANSHQVILGVLDKVCESAPADLVARVQHMGDAEELEDEHAQFPFSIAKDYPKVAEGLGSGRLAVVGGTSYAWTRDELAGTVDVLFVDEAGQLSLANVLAISRAAGSMVLVGDPAQLDQPTKGAHPPGAEVSALEHLMGDATTMPDHLGVFLPETRRLHPAICEFTSQVFYDNRLTPIPGLEARRIDGPVPFNGSGLRFVPVEHEGRTNRSDEEADQVATIVRQLLASGTRYHDEMGARPLTARDILVVAPYNAQVGAIRERLGRLDVPELAGDAVQIGTVDKFQGKEAPVVVYSMTTSSGDDAPRGLEFLYSLNRLNVATSRAQALVILVMNPALTGTRCRTPRQMKLVNGLCAYLGRAG